MTSAEYEQQQRRGRPSIHLRRLTFLQMLNQSQNSIKIDRNAVHLWYAFPDDWSDEELQHCYQQILTPGEQEKCRRFVFEKDRRICAVACVLIRGALSSYCKIPPWAWRFSINKYGKPAIASPKGIDFNLSHTAGLIVAAIVRDRNVGVDVENVNQKVDFSVADFCFAPEELAFFSRQTLADRAETFLGLWTLKEAYMKARGTGLSILPADVAFAVNGSRERPTLKSAPADRPNRWDFIRPGCFLPQYQLAVAIEQDCHSA